MHRVHKISSPLTNPEEHPRQYSGKNKLVKSENSLTHGFSFDLTANKLIFALK
jgi:hypothetical protein